MTSGAIAFSDRNYVLFAENGAMLFGGGAVSLSADGLFIAGQSTMSFPDNSLPIAPARARCQWCGQWGERFTACEFCGGAVN